MLLYLITHAHTHPDRNTEATRWSLSETGQQQAELLARQPFWDQVDRIVVSSEAKTTLTIRPVLARRNLPVWIDLRFDELRRGGWVADYPAQVHQALANPTVAVGGWEPANQALQRFLAGIGDVRVRFAGETLALVGHGLTLSLYRAYLLAQPQVDLEEWRQLSFAAVALVDATQGKLLQDFHAVAGELPRG
jgi:broad specificity phosphatase PhoE